jgi:hypothetical protein
MIPCGVKNIEEGAFDFCKLLTSAAIPGDAMIEWYAFGYCKKLDAVYIYSDKDRGTVRSKWKRLKKQKYLFPEHTVFYYIANPIKEE